MTKYTFGHPIFSYAFGHPKYQPSKDTTRYFEDIVVANDHDGLVGTVSFSFGTPEIIEERNWMKF